MKIRLSCIAATGVAVALIAGCATRPVPNDQLEKMAFITSGNANFRSALRLGPKIKVTEVDGRPNPRPYGPIELAPGVHKITMSCGDAINTLALDVMAGEVYQFEIARTPGAKGCSGSLVRVREANPAAKAEAEQRAQAEQAKKEQLAQAERARAEQLARAERAQAERAQAVAAKPVPGATARAPATEQREVAAAIERWADAWSRKDISAYLAAYAKDFVVPGSRSRRQWEAQRRQRIVGKRSIEVRIEGLEIGVEGNTAVASFTQHYRSGRLVDTTNKMLTLVKTGGAWLIKREGKNEP